MDLNGPTAPHCENKQHGSQPLSANSFCILASCTIPWIPPLPRKVILMPAFHIHFPQEHQLVFIQMEINFVTSFPCFNLLCSFPNSFCKTSRICILCKLASHTLSSKALIGLAMLPTPVHSRAPLFNSLHLYRLVRQVEDLGHSRVGGGRVRKEVEIPGFHMCSTCRRGPVGGLSPRRG